MRESDSLKLDWYTGQDSAGDAVLSEQPLKAYFSWKDAEGCTCHSEVQNRASLEAEISERERAGEAVPPEFREALKDLSR
jgi:hypothetical protein